MSRQIAIKISVVLWFLFAFLAGYFSQPVLLIIAFLQYPIVTNYFVRSDE